MWRWTGRGGRLLLPQFSESSGSGSEMDVEADGQGQDQEQDPGPSVPLTLQKQRQEHRQQLQSNGQGMKAEEAWLVRIYDTLAGTQHARVLCARLPFNMNESYKPIRISNKKDPYIWPEMMSQTVVCESPYVSFAHCYILYCKKVNDQDEYAHFLFDLHSAHGTYVNNTKVSPYEGRELEAGDMISIGVPVQGEEIDLGDPKFCVFEYTFEGTLSQSLFEGAPGVEYREMLGDGFIATSNGVAMENVGLFRKARITLGLSSDISIQVVNAEPSPDTSRGARGRGSGRPTRSIAGRGQRGGRGPRESGGDGVRRSSRLRK